MFDLESSIAAWRKEMLAAPIPLETLNELESHLRDRIVHLQSGLSEKDAFQTALIQLGSQQSLKKEFARSHCIFHWENPPSLHALTIFYACWGFYTAYFITVHGFHFPGLRAYSQLHIWSVVLYIGVAFGLLYRQNFWRVYALISTAIGCIFPSRDWLVYFTSAASFPAWQWSAQHVFFLFNFAVNLWALYILSRTSIRQLFQPKTAAPA